MRSPVVSEAVRSIGIFMAVISMFSAVTAFAGDVPGSTIVYHYPGKGRVHRVECRRLTKDPKELATLEKMTLAEAEKKGLSLCSRCPGSTTAGKGNPGAGEAKGGGGPESWVNPPKDTAEKTTFRPSPLSPLVSLAADGKLVYKPYSDKGDRALDWSFCGYRNSEVPIPAVPAVITLEPPAGAESPDGNMKYPMGSDSTRAIQAAIDKVAAMKPGPSGSKGAVLLKKGTYYIQGGLKVPSGVVLRGEGDGADGTVIIAKSSEGGGNAITVGSETGVEHVGEKNASRISEDYVPSGSNVLTLESAGQFKAGDYVCIKKTVNDKWIEVIGCGERLRHIRGGKEGAFKKPWEASAYQFRHIRQVKSVSGSMITLNVMLPQSFQAEHGGGEVYKVDAGSLAVNCGVESLRIVSNYDTTVRDKSKSSNFINFRNGIVARNCMDSWVRSCTVLHVSMSGVGLNDNAMQVTVRDCKNIEPVGPKRGGNYYAFLMDDCTLNLFYKCYSEDGRHCFAGGSRTMGPNAFVNCTAVRGGQSEPHHRWGCGFLYDNVSTKDGTLAAINRGDSGSGHGWAAANTTFWNCSAKNVVVFDPETDGENNFAIGFKGPMLSEYDPRGVVYANTRSGYWGTPREGKYYGYALMGNGFIESPDKPVAPDSLFTQQLAERIGQAKAAAVLK